MLLHVTRGYCWLLQFTTDVTTIATVTTVNAVTTSNYHLVENYKPNISLSIISL